MSQQQQPPKERHITYYLVPDEEPDLRMSRAYLAEKGVELGQNCKAVTELIVPRLTDRHRVICLSRDNARDHGELIEVPGQPPINKMVHAPLRASEPIMCERFWTRPTAQDAYAEGELSIGPFLSAISKAASPAIVKWKPESEPGKLRLKYC